MLYGLGSHIFLETSNKTGKMYICLFIYFILESYYYYYYYYFRWHPFGLQTLGIRMEGPVHGNL